jgi:type IV pilus assembly protein PilE
MKQYAGMSLLIELLVVIGIVGIMVSLAVPNYTSHITHKRRLVAETELMRVAGLMEAFYAEHHTYEGATIAALAAPESVAQNTYKLAIKSSTPINYELEAVPQMQQAVNDAKCGVLILTSGGFKQMGGTGKLNECW